MAATITYRNTVLDHMLFNLAHLFSLPLVQAFHIGIGLFAVWSFDDESMPVRFGLGLFYYLLCWVIQCVFTTLLVLVQREKTVLTTHELELRAEGISARNEFCHSLWFWKSVLKTVVRGRCLAIYTMQNGAHLVPLRAFGSKRELDAFRAAIAAGTGKKALPGS